MDLKLAEADKKKMDQLSANKKVFVGGLEPSVDASISHQVQLLDDLKRYFEKLGAVVQDAIVLRNVHTNVSRGFGFITFDSEEMADKFVQINNYTIKGKKIDIKKAEPKQNKERHSRYFSK